MLAAAYVHYHLVFDPRYASFCDINTTVNCSQVYLSRYSTVSGVPVAVYGAMPRVLQCEGEPSGLFGSLPPS